MWMPRSTGHCIIHHPSRLIWMQGSLAPEISQNRVAWLQQKMEKFLHHNRLLVQLRKLAGEGMEKRVRYNSHRLNSTLARAMCRHEYTVII